MVNNLITLDLGGLLQQLTGIETQCNELQKHVETHDKQVRESQTSLTDFKLRNSDQLTEIKIDLRNFKQEFKETNETMKDMDSLVVKIKDNVARAEAIERKQQEFNTDCTQKLRESKTGLSQFKKDAEQQISERVTQLEFEEKVTNTLQVKTETLEAGQIEIKEQLQKCDDEIQQILDRVETMETHGVQPQKIQESALSMPEEGETAEHQDEEVKEAKQELPKEVKPAEPDELKLVEEFIKQAVFDNRAKDRKELFDLALEEFQPQEEAKVESKDEEEVPAEKVDSDQESEEPPPETAPAEQPAEPQIAISHYPSTIEQILEDHVRTVGTHLVWLDRMRPKFVMEDGRLALGSDYQQVFSHVEVQTYQQQLLLKNQQHDGRMLVDLKNQVEELKRGLKVESKRIDVLEEGADVDLTHLQVDGAGLKELFRIMQELKTEVLQKSASKDSIRNIEREILDIKAKSQAAKQSTMDQELKEELQQGLILMAQFPSQLQSLQLQIMKSETLSYDVERSCQQIQRRMNSFEETASAVTKDFEQLQQPDQSAQDLEKVKDLAAIKYFCQSQFVSVSQHQEFNDSVSSQLSQMTALQNSQQQNQSKLADHGKTIRSQTQQVKQMEARMAKLQQKAQLAETGLKERVSFDVFNEEMGYVKSLAVNAKGGPVQKQSAAQMPQAQRSAVGGQGGLSATMKNQIKETIEAVDRHDMAIRRLNQGFQSLNTTELQADMAAVQKSLREKASKLNFDKLEVGLTQDVLASKAQQKIQQDEIDRQVSKTDERLERFFYAQSERDDQVKSLTENVGRIEETIVSMKRNNAAGNLRNKLLKQSEEPKPSNFIPMESDNDNEDQNITKLKDEMYKNNKQFKTKLTWVENKVKKLIPLIDDGEDDKKSAGSKKNDLESRLTDKVFKMASNQNDQIFKIKNVVEQLKKAFEEKIRRQALVHDFKVKKNNTIADDQVDLKKSLNKRPKFLAQQMTRELVVNGRLPQFENYGDHIARYGKGFSQMLNLASIEGEPTTQGRNAFSPKIISGQSQGYLSDGSPFEGNEMTSQPAYQDQDALSTNSAQRVALLKQAASDPDFQSLERTYAPIENPHEHRIMHLKSQRVHPMTKQHVFSVKKEQALRPANMTALVVPSEAELPQPNDSSWLKNSGRLPMISTSRSITNENNLIQMQDSQQDTN